MDSSDKMKSNDLFSQLLPLIVGLGVVVLTAIAAKLYLDKKKVPPVTLKNPDEKVALELIDKERISHDTYRLRFRLPSPNHILGLPVGQHIYLSAHVNGKLTVRPYTPVSSDNDKGFMELVVKVYFKNEHPKFPDGGKLSQYLFQLPLGQLINVRGPNGLLKYLNCGVFSTKANKKGPQSLVNVHKINMIAGGTGITPMLQLIRQITGDENDHTRIALLYANQTEDDILLRKELEHIHTNYPDQFNYWYTVDRPKEDWQYSTGFVNEEMIKEHLFSPEPESLVLMCGPPPMIQFACEPNLDKLGYSSKLRFTY